MIKVANRKAFIRVAVIFVLGGVLLSYAWWTMIRMPLKTYAGTLPALTPQEQNLAADLRNDVRSLAEQIGERHVFQPNRLNQAAAFISRAFNEAGYQVSPLDYTVENEPCSNLEISIPGHERPNEIIVVGAHYDSVYNCPGANDNATGVAALLALARSLATTEFSPSRTLRLVAFANEEPPWFQTPNMGSLVYARQCRERGDNIVGMLSLETIGYYSDQKGSQSYPFPLGMFYPSQGDFIAFVGNTSCADLVRFCVMTFRQEVSFPSEGAALPGVLPGIGWSDHWAFWQAGYPALMITDTAPFRYPYYHTTGDTPEKLDYERMARVVAGVEKVLKKLANHPGPLAPVPD